MMHCVRLAKLSQREVLLSKYFVMAACPQKIKSSQLLPNHVVTEQQSLVLIKKLLAIAVSGITYLRGLFPEKAYGAKCVEDQSVMLLREERSCPGAIQIIQWLQGCFEAIEKKYLQAVILSISTDPDNPQKVTELYQFRIQYTSAGAQMDFHSNNNISTVLFGNTKKASTMLIMKLYMLMQNLGPLPDHVCLNMKLAYYNDVTPQDYHPAGFKEADKNALEFEKEPVKLSMGGVVTPFHTLKVDMATERRRVEQVEGSVCVKEKWVFGLEDGVLSQGHVLQEIEKTATGVEFSGEEKMCEATEICEFIPNRQETLSTTASKSRHSKRRRFSKPSEPY